jgi:nitronate monooxygenase
VHRSNRRLSEDVAVLQRHRPEFVIASVGLPEPVLRPLHDCGALVLADAASLCHAEKAAEVGANGLVLLTAGRRRTNRLAQSTCIRACRPYLLQRPSRSCRRHSDGYALLLAELMGFDLAYMGTKFIATCESLASGAYKAMLVKSNPEHQYAAAIYRCRGPGSRPLARARHDWRELGH